VTRKTAQTKLLEFEKGKLGSELAFLFSFPKTS